MLIRPRDATDLFKDAYDISFEWPKNAEQVANKFVRDATLIVPMLTPAAVGHHFAKGMGRARVQLVLFVRSWLRSCPLINFSTNPEEYFSISNQCMCKSCIRLTNAALYNFLFTVPDAGLEDYVVEESMTRRLLRVLTPAASFTGKLKFEKVKGHDGFTYDFRSY